MAIANGLGLGNGKGNGNGGVGNGNGNGNAKDYRPALIARGCTERGARCVGKRVETLSAHEQLVGTDQFCRRCMSGCGR